jgi:FixJ family two-component response regulator
VFAPSGIFGRQPRPCRDPAIVTSNLFLTDKEGTLTAPMIGIVDDDESLRVSLSSFIRSEGFDAVLFASAEEFLESGCLHRVACLILDADMPGLGGLELQRQLSEAGRPIPIIFVTADADRIRDVALKQGARAVFPKPFIDEGLLAAIQAALGLGAI